MHVKCKEKKIGKKSFYLTFSGWSSCIIEPWWAVFTCSLACCCVGWISQYTWIQGVCTWVRNGKQWLWNYKLNWLAIQDQPQMTRGSVSFSGIWTTEIKCDKVTFSQVTQPSFLQVFYLENDSYLWYRFFLWTHCRVLVEGLLRLSQLSTHVTQSLMTQCMFGWRTWIAEVFRCTSGNSYQWFEAPRYYCGRLTCLWICLIF